jgi:hypothetical protein
VRRPSQEEIASQIPQGLKPADFVCPCGTAEAVPFQNGDYSGMAEAVPLQNEFEIGL